MHRVYMRIRSHLRLKFESAVREGPAPHLGASAQSRDAEIAALKAQLEILQAKVAELEERSDAQSGVNIDTAGALDKLANNSTLSQFVCLLS